MTGFVGHVSLNLVTRPPGSIAAVAARIRSAGLEIANIQYQRLRNMPEVTLGLPGREEAIAQFVAALRESADIGVDYSTYPHMADGIWMSPPVAARGGALSRLYDPADAEGYWLGERYAGDAAHGRRYTQAEIWDNLAFFMDRVLPEAERLGVRLGALFKVHLRNVSSAPPVFTETFIDEGYGDMPTLARALRDNAFDGILIADHVPAMVGGRHASWAYPVGYIKGLFDAVGSESSRVGGASGSVE